MEAKLACKELGSHHSMLTSKKLSKFVRKEIRLSDQTAIGSTWRIGTGTDISG